MNSLSTPTALSRKFPLWESEDEAAQSWVEFGERTPAKARYASSVVLLRDGDKGAKTLLSYRRGYSPLGTVAFPGGSVESTDREPIDWVGPSSEEWAQRLGLSDASLAQAHVVAAIRETFEETGILLAGTDASSLADLTGRADLMAKREAMVNGEVSFAEMLNRRGLAVRTDLLKPIINWVSPDFAHRRFNTWYFAVAKPANQDATPLTSKDFWQEWVCPKKLVEDETSTQIGDTIGAENTVGRPLPKLMSSGGEMLLHKIAKANGCIAFLNAKRPPMAFQPQLRHEAGEYWLEVDTPKNLEGVCRER